MKISTRISGAFLIGLLAVILLAWTSHANIERISETRRWVENSLEVIVEKEVLQSTLRDLESRTRAYVATGEERFLEGSEELRKKIDRCYNNLLVLTDDNAAQQRNLSQLSPLLNKRVEQLGQLVEARKQVGEEAKKFLRLPEAGSQWQWALLMEKIRNEEEDLLKQRTAETIKSIEETQSLVVLIAILSTVAIGLTGAYIVIGLTKSIKELIDGTERVARGEVDFGVTVNTGDEISILARAFNSMVDRLRAMASAQESLIWHRTKINQFVVALEGQRGVESAAAIILDQIVSALGAHHAALYAAVDDDCTSFRRAATYGASDESEALPETIKNGEGLVGQCALDKKKVVVHDLHPDSFVIKSALTKSKPLELVVLPCVFAGQTRGVIEIASLSEFSQAHQEFLDALSARIGAVLHFTTTSTRIDFLLNEAQMLVEELQAQQEEMECQQDELRSTNEELEEKTEALDLQNQEITDKNLELEQVRLRLEEKANELALASKYKSQFLANMSHDLRTPLNSLLIFSELLSDNDEKNLQDFQVDYARNIHSAGKTLLGLIDDILDLSRIESGTVNLDLTELSIEDIASEMQRNFEKIAESKSLEFEIKIDPAVSAKMKTDRKRLSQLLTNLLGNAFKFTETGSIRLGVASSDELTDGATREKCSSISFSVIDTGIGIKPEMHELVFEAFRQADGSIKKKYGGTGLGLAICRQLSELLGGHIVMDSIPGQGSTFTVVLPVVYDGQREKTVPAGRPQLVSASRELEKNLEISREVKILMQTEIEDDRRNIDPEDRVMLMIEDDPAFARMLLDMARKHAFKGVVALTGSEGLALARRLVPDGITLDLKLPDMEGWVLLDQLKISADTRHIPVHIISVEQERQRSLEAGAIGLLEKPVTVSSLTDAIERIKSMIARQEASILLVEHDDALRDRFTDLLSDTSVKVCASATGEDALRRVREERFDCVVVDVNLDDVKGTELIERIQKSGSDPAKAPPVLIYANRDLSPDEVTTLNRLRRSSMVKDVDSPERLLNEVLLFLHRVEASLPEPKRKILDSLRGVERPLIGRKILIVDDDPRNIAALTGALQRQQMELIYAENGKDAIDRLQQHPDIELVLMDIMMPVMDGYEAMQAIRQMTRFQRLPIIAVTAKSMKEDRRRCLESGASDYIAKPVDRSQLLSLLKVWLYKA